MSYFLNQFPYSDFHEMNLDWILKTVKKVYEDMGNFKAANEVSYEGIWNITNQYERNDIVLDQLRGYLMISIQPVPAGIDILNTDYWIPVSPFKIDIDFDAGSYNAIANKTVTNKFAVVDDAILTEETERKEKDDELEEKINLNTEHIEENTAAIEEHSATISEHETSIEQNTEDIADISSRLSSEITARTSADSVINSRIDNIVALPEGSTQGDAELMDIRVGANGITYASAGDAVRGQYNELKDSIISPYPTDNLELNRILVEYYDSNIDPSEVSWIRACNGISDFYGFRFYDSDSQLIYFAEVGQDDWISNTYVEKSGFKAFIGDLSILDGETYIDYKNLNLNAAVNNVQFGERINERITADKIHTQAQIKSISENWTIRNLEEVEVTTTTGYRLDKKGNTVSDANYSIIEFSTGTKKSFRINRLNFGGNFNSLKAIEIKKSGSIIAEYFPIADEITTLVLENIIGSVKICYRNNVTPIIYSGEITIVNQATPEMYGAIGDGIADDTVAIRNALANNNEVFFANLYKVTSSIIINESNRKLIGTGGFYRSNGIFYTGDNVLFVLKGSGNVVTDLALWSTAENTAKCFRHDAEDGNNDLKCVNCHFNNWQIVDAGTGRGHIFENCDISSVNKLIDLAYNFAGGDDELQGMYGNRRIKVSNCTFHVMYGNFTTNSALLKINDSTGERPAYGIQISDNYVDGMSQILIGNSNFIGLEITNNTFIKVNNQRFMVYVTGEIIHSNISENMILNNDLAGETYQLRTFISAKNIRYSIIKNNIIRAFIGAPFINATGDSGHPSTSGVIVGSTICSNYMGNTDSTPIACECNKCIIKDNYANAEIDPEGSDNIIEDNNIITFE